MPKPTPRQLAKTDQANAAADKFIDDVLVDMVSQIEQGVQHANITARIGSGIISLGLGEVERLVVAARALARLARMHHAVEQLADVWTRMAAVLPTVPTRIVGETVSPAERQAAVEAIKACIEDLRKLVNDHG